MRKNKRMQLCVNSTCVKLQIKLPSRRKTTFNFHDRIFTCTSHGKLKISFAEI